MNRNKFHLTINKKLLPLYILLFVPCFKWFFEGVLGDNRIEILILFGALLLMLINKGSIKLKKQNFIWFLYIASIFFSIFIHDHTRSTVLNALLVLFITLFAIFADYSISDYKGAIKFVIVIGLFNAVMVMIHYIFKEQFNSFYFPFLQSTSLDYASKYYAQGMFFGFFFTPADAAGIISFSVFAILFLKILNKRKNRLSYVWIVLLFVPFLLTGKKGVLLISIISAVFVFLVLYGSKKQWFRVLGILLVVIIGYLFARYYISTHQSNPLFYRLSEFLSNLESGDTYDSGRSILYGYALNQWNSHKIFGIGWRNFSDLTTSLYGYVRSHQVNCDYLQFLCETGIFGTILIVTPIVITLYRTIYICRKAISQVVDGQIKWVMIFAIFIQFYILMYAVVEVPFYDIFFYTIYMLSCMIINKAYIQTRYGKGISLCNTIT